MGVHMTGAFPNQLSKDIDVMFNNEYARSEEEWAGFLHLDNLTDSYRNEGEMSGLYSVQEMNEGQPVPFETIKEGNTKKLESSYWGLGVQLTSIMMEDDRFGHLKNVGTELGRAMTVSKELRAWDLLNSGFVTTTRVGIDAKALFADDHPILDSGTSTTTIDNKGTGAFSYTTLQSGIDYFENLLDEKGVPCPSKPDLLIIGPSNRWLAEKYMLSEWNPENANQQYNSVGKLGIRFKVVHWLTSSTAWFLANSKHDLRFIWRRTPKTEAQVDFNTGNLMKKVTARFTTDFVRHRYIYGSTGA